MSSHFTHASQRPIGVFDSGLGGLTVLSALQKQLPNSAFLYFADTRFLPYGDRSETFLRERGVAISQHLEQLGCQAIVIACNTATAAAAESIRAQCNLPVVALEPAVKPAVALSQKQRIGVIATTRTIDSQRFRRLLENYASKSQVITQACPGLAEAIETDGPNSAVVGQLLDQYICPLANADIDVLVLGCTHYPLVKQAIAARLGEHVQMVDSGEAVARQVERRILENGHTPQQASAHQALHILTSGAVHHVALTVQRLWGSSLPVEHSAI